jgi:hypothetical protein
MRKYSKSQQARLLAGMIKAVAEFRGLQITAVEEEIGREVGCSPATLERIKNGITPLNEPFVVKGLATIAVRDGYFGVAWLRQFLQTARYAQAEALIAELVGQEPQLTDVAPPVGTGPWYDNLGLAPFGGALVPRRELMAELLRALESVPVVVLLGLGAMGKTSMAYHVATLCREQYGSVVSAATYQLPREVPAVQAVIWASDGARAGETTLGHLQDIIARTFDHPGLSANSPEVKEASVRALLAAVPTLIVLDNAETITDPTLLTWLIDLPAQTRVLITSRQMADVFMSERVKVVRVDGLTEAEARRLMREHARYLGYQHLSDDSQQMLIQRTGSCPQALKQIIGYAVRARQPLGVVADQFDALVGDLLADVFGSCWSTILNDDARTLLLTLSCFDDPVTWEVLMHVTSLDQKAFRSAIKQLGDVSLIDMHASTYQQGEVRYGLHPLTRSFILMRRAENAALIDRLDKQRIKWAARYAGSFGYRVDDLGLLARLETDEPTLMRALRDADKREMHEEVVELARGIEFYYYIKCRWDDKLTLHRYYIAAAQALGDEPQLVTALTMHIQLLCRLERSGEAIGYLEQLEPLADRATGEERFHVHHARALYHHTRGDYQQAQVEWRLIDHHAADWGLPPHMQIGALHWLGLNFLAMEEVRLARTAFEQSWQLARRAPRPVDRWIARNQIQLALIDLAVGNRISARARIDESRELLAESDREQRAHLLRVEAKLLKAEGKPEQAQAAKEESRNLFVRMGLLHEMAK